MKQLSIIIPAYNEADAIQAGKLGRVREWLDQQPFDSELLVVDDGSQDATSTLAAETARVITIPHAGKAAAIVAGIHAAAGDVVLFTDMDQATPLSEAPKLLACLDQGAQVCVGSRGLVRKGAPPGRYLLSWGQFFLRNVLLGLRITDTQCGFKAFTRTAALAVLDALVVYRPANLGTIHVPSVSSGFDVEFLYVAQRLGYRISEEPVIWNYQETRRVHVVRDAWRGVQDLVAISAAALARKYPR